MKAEVTAVIPTIPVRRNLLKRAVASVYDQTVQPIRIATALDRKREGSAVTRNRALDMAETHWVAFLDDDDYWLPEHVETLLTAANGSGADVVYSGCVVLDGNDDEVPMQEEWGRFGKEFDPDLLRQKSYLPVTSLVRTSLAQRARFGAPAGTDYDDWGFYLRLLDMGAQFLHVPVVTWIWPHWGGNTSGRGDRW